MVAKVDRPVYRGDTKILIVALWSNRYRRVPFDLTGATLVGKVRQTAGGSVLATLACTLLPAVGTATYRNRVQIELTAADSSALAPGNYLYDVRATLADTRVYTIVRGTFAVEQSVSGS